MEATEKKPDLAIQRFKHWKRLPGIILGLVFVFRLMLSLLPSDAIDMGGYKAWSLFLATRGFEGFYQTFHVVYGPGYMYLLWLSGKLTLLFGSFAQDFIIKFWMVLSDFATGSLIYVIAKEKGKTKLGFWLGIGYVLNPAIIFNSSVWGQFESLATLIMLGTVYFFLHHKKGIACILYTVAMLVKPQCAMLLPLAVVLAFKNFKWRDLGLALPGMAATYITLMLPFSTKRSIFWIFGHYLKSGGDYPYATANGFNLWTLLGGQTAADTQPFWGMTYLKWSFVFLTLVVMVSIYMLRLKKESHSSVYLAAFFLCFGFFMVGTRMHERYLYPALAFLTVCLVWDLKWLPSLIGLSLCHFVNTWYIYIRGWQDQIWAPPDDPIAWTVASITLIIFIFTIVYSVGMGLSRRKSSAIE